MISSGLRGLSGPVKTRFAPSPTGELHLGGLRTALFNFLLAKKHDGVFCLRIEDTDRSRLVRGAEDRLASSLGRCGLGDFEKLPNQSSRLNTYTEIAKNFLESDDAYRCFCSKARLDAMRKRASARGLSTSYDGRCASISSSESEMRCESGEPFVVRMRVDGGRRRGDRGRRRDSIRVVDGLKGNVDFPINDVDDQIIIKRDGFPTYHLASVVDDAEFQISHVIRGEEWLTSTPKHVLLYEYMQKTPPHFVHVPLLTMNNKKLSKRDGSASSVQDLLDGGISPMALLNFVVLLGWAPSNANADTVYEDMNSLVEAFDISLLNNSSANVDFTKLEYFNTEHTRRMKLEDIRKMLPFDVSEAAIDAARSRARIPKDYVDLTECFDLTKHELDWFDSKACSKIRKSIEKKYRNSGLPENLFCDPKLTRWVLTARDVGVPLKDLMYLIPEPTRQARALAFKKSFPS